MTMLSCAAAGTKAVFAGVSTRSQPAPTQYVTPPQRPPAPAVIGQIRAAFAHRARREAIGPPRRSVWSILYGVAALDFRIGLGQGDIRTRQRPVHHRTAHRATRHRSGPPAPGARPSSIPVAV